MLPPKPQSRVFRFGSFEADLQGGQLTKSGIRIKLQDQPFQILELLLERPGQVVSREEIRQKLWSENTFVEFDDALNTAVRKLRTALGDPADNPRFVETVPRRGYRFVAPVSLTPESEADAYRAAQAESAVPSPAPYLDPGAPAESRRITPYAWSVIAAIALLAVAGTAWYLRRPVFHITPRDTLVLADFVNTTGEGVFDDTLKQGLAVGLEQSPFFNVLSDRKASAILRQMGRSPEGGLTGKVAIEVCQRANSKVAVEGSISSLGSTYLIGLAGIRCDSGEPIAHEQVEAKRKEDVVEALGKATTMLRARLGESLPSIQKYNTLLEQATTPSLDALQAYSQGLATWDKKGDRASIPFFGRAIELDPNFAMAHAALGTVYHNLGEDQLARGSTTQAYGLRDRVTEAERVSIESRYDLYVTGDLEKTAETYEVWAQNYPESAGALNHLGTTEAELGRYEKATVSLGQAMRLDPTRATTYANLAMDLFALNRFDEGAAVLDEAEKRKLQTDYLMQANYWRAFLRHDNAGMQRLLLQASDVPGAQPLLLSAQANTEAYYGHYEKARELSGVAADLMEHNQDRESAAACLADVAVREAEAGAFAFARQYLARAQKLAPSTDVRTLAALVMARTGNLNQARTLSAQLDREFPSDTMMQKYWLPVIRAAIEVQQGQGLRASAALIPAAPLEMASPGRWAVAAIYPAYVRGQAYLLTGDATAAAAEFQKLLDHAGAVLNSPLTPLASLGRARAYARTSDTARTRVAYKEFLDLWKDADPDIPLFKQAKSEYAALR